MTPLWKDRLGAVRPYGIALVLAALALAGVARAAAPRPQGPRTPTVAVVDMSAVLNASNEWRDMAQQRSKMLQNAKEALSNLTQKAQVLRSEYDNLPPGTDEHTAKAKELQTALQNLQNAQRSYQGQVAQSYSSATRTMFGKITKIVDAYAHEHNIDLVLKTQTLDLNGPETIGQNIMLATTEVLYADPSLEINKVVIDRLNAAYKGPIEVK